MSSSDELKKSITQDETSQKIYETESQYYKLIKYLKELRKSQKITQAELANRMNVSQQGVSKLEQCNANMSLRMFLKYFDGLGINLVKTIKTVDKENI